MIDGCWFKDKFLEFHDGDTVDDKNIFTIIVGRNGSGKSRLLRELVNSFAKVPELRSERGLFEGQDDHIEVMFNTNNLPPTKIIATSTSPFDKFPVDRRGERAGYYEYLGLKGLPSANLSLGFMSKTIGSLVRAINHSQSQAQTILGVLNYLGYHDVIRGRFVLEPSPARLQQIFSDPEPVQRLLEYASNRIMGAPMNFLRMQNLSGAADYNKEVVDALFYFMEFNKKPRVDIFIDRDGARDAVTAELINEQFIVLLEAGFLRLRDITLHKKGVSNPFRINDASSGEQCVVMALLGIAGQIKDGSLICIDEPEICLHPEWQERYIELLMSTFEGFKSCHFVVATHSPQIVSMLGDENCYVVDIQSGNTHHAKYLNKRSADFQLASIFGAPGYKNEYLSRELISALATLGSGERLSAQKLLMMDQIISLKNYLNETDPVRRLIDMLIDALREI
ncbi:AAA family ATPase [Pseudomonas palmensis]